MSNSASDLFRKMTRSNPPDRITVEKVLDHPWFDSLKPPKKPVKNLRVKLSDVGHKTMTHLRKPNSFRHSPAVSRQKEPIHI